MSLLENIHEDMIDATRKGDTERSEILKMMFASVKNEEIDAGKTLSDDEVIKILRKESKKIQDSIDQFNKMNRLDLVHKEELQLNVIKEYLPELMEESQIKEIAMRVIKENNVQGIKDMGKVMGIVMKEINGQADGNTVRNIVSQLLS